MNNTPSDSKNTGLLLAVIIVMLAVGIFCLSFELNDLRLTEAQALSDVRQNSVQINFQLDDKGQVFQVAYQYGSNMDSANLPTAAAIQTSLVQAFQADPHSTPATAAAIQTIAAKVLMQYPVLNWLQLSFAVPADKSPVTQTAVVKVFNDAAA